MEPRAPPVWKLKSEARHPVKGVYRMRRPTGVLSWREVRLETRPASNRTARASPVGPLSREGFRVGVLEDALHERSELCGVMPCAPRHADRERPAGRCPGEDVKLGEVPDRLGIMVRPPRSRTEEDEACGVDREDLLDCPEWAFGLREKVLQGERHPVAAVVLLQRVEVWNVDEPEGRFEELEEAHGAPEAQVEVRADEEAEHELAPRDPWPPPAPLPIANRARLREGLQEQARETNFLALPAVVLTPVPAVDTLTYLASALGQGGSPSQVLGGDLTEELGSLSLNGSPVLETSAVTVHEAFVCTPVVGDDMGRVEAFTKRYGYEYFNEYAPPGRRIAATRNWINARMDQGYTIVDIGPAPGRQFYPYPTGRYYRVELLEIGNRNYERYLPMWGMIN